eukprot:COSAG03_NODE_429_length_7977_cov_3.949606_6_plen_87_part_00
MHFCVWTVGKRHPGRLQSVPDPQSPWQNYDTIGSTGFVYLMGRRTPIPQVTRPRGYYIRYNHPPRRGAGEGEVSSRPSTNLWVLHC